MSSLKKMTPDTAVAHHEFLTALAFLKGDSPRRPRFNSHGTLVRWVLQEFQSAAQGLIHSNGYAARRCRLEMQSVSILTNMGFKIVPVPGGGGTIDVMLRTSRHTRSR